MKHLFYIALLGGAVLFSSCESEEIFSFQQEIHSVKFSEKVKLEESNLSAVASMLSKISVNNETCNEVHKAVTQALDYGLEESYYFQEILNNKTKINTTRSNSQLLGDLISSYYKNSTNRLLNSDSTDLETLANSNIQIYWPYSENWDGKTLPVITFAPEDEDQEWNYAFKINGEKIDTIIVDENYMENNPVWIVNNSEIAYEDLPYFSQNQYSKNNVHFLADTGDKQNMAKIYTSTKAIGDPVYTVYIGKFMASKHYDSVFRGGSDFVIQMGQAQDYNITEENLSSLNMRVNLYKVHRSRKDIKNKRWKTLDYILTSDWLPEENDAAFMIHEEDNGGTKRWDPELSFSIKGKEYKAKISIPYGKKDEIICKTIYSRNFIFSTNNIEGTIHHSSDVHFTLPYKVGRVVE